MRIYLVGGAVRDEFLLRPVNDRDFVVLHADAEALRRRMSHLRYIGKGGPLRDEGVFLNGADQYTLSPSGDIHQDLLQRDLTVNALARDIADGSLAAHPLALHDLQHRLLRPISVASFGQDPCRAVRAARFAADLPGFAPLPLLFTAMRHAVSQGLGRVAAERVGQELRKACAGAQPGRFLALLGRAGCLSPWFAPFAGKPLLRQAAQAVMQRLAGAPPLWVFMGMCRHLNAQQAQAMAARLRLPVAWQQAGRAAVELTPLLSQYEGMPLAEKLGLLLQCHRSRLLAALCRLARACLLLSPQQAYILRRRMEGGLLRVLDVRLAPDERDRGPASGKALQARRLAALQRFENAWQQQGSGCGFPGQPPHLPEQRQAQHEEDDEREQRAAGAARELGDHGKDKGPADA